MSMPTKEVTSGVVTTISDQDLVMVAGSGGWKPIAFSDLMNAVRGRIQVGGRNYIPNSNFFNGIGGISVVNGTAVIITNTYETREIRFGSKALHIKRTGQDTYFHPIDIGKLEAGRQYTLTLWGRQAGAMTSASSYIYVDGMPSILLDTKFSKQNVYERKSITFTLPIASGVSPDSPSYRDVKLRLGFGSSGEAWMLIEAMKLEQGNVATDWSPAPEDIASSSWGGGKSKIYNHLQIRRFNPNACWRLPSYCQAERRAS